MSFPTMSDLKRRAGRIVQLSRAPRLALFEAHRKIGSPRKRGLLADAAAFLLRQRNGLLFPSGADGAVNEAELKLAND
ncbi:MAG TPA: hypothetical protein VNO55_21950, partial [Polyangia bacterium]|nr:hypothetical protein [Polyangia bacterium]